MEAGTLTPWLIEVVGSAAAVLGTLCWLPQSVKVIREKQTAGISLAANLMLLSAVSLWMIYGLLIGSWPLVLANAVSTTLVLTIVVMKIRYRHPQQTDRPAMAKGADGPRPL